MSDEEVTIEYKEKKYSGRRAVEGSRKMYQTIYYGARSRADGHAYRPGEETNMRLMANIILRELVEEELRDSGEGNA